MTAEELRECHAIVWQWRAKLADVWPTPNRLDALRFAVTEAAEAMDAWLRLNGGYARNHDKSLSVEDELADCAMMLLTAAGKDWQPSTEPALRRLTLECIVFEVAVLCFEDSIESVDFVFATEAGDIVATIAAYPGMNNLAERINARLERIAERRLATWQQ
jgi:hypothetical protein